MHNKPCKPILNSLNWIYKYEAPLYG